ncbi:glycosyltransferase family 4 protein [Steroidobacter cummioxidans]|uniref:glycosyltransferase family 4 protein n=1 Tax=Steroidobacter cummioxidans TaxID=1803913 RepID=UPI0019D4ACD6|nr:glycosyltransferase family 4 protein [Steroidobacter cummioxidans]
MLVLPGDLLTATGGYEYDRRMLEGLRQLRWNSTVVALDSSFPTPTAQALEDAQRQLSALPADSLVVIDGLALGAMPEVVHAHKDRLRMVGLIHHPLAAETGLSPELVSRLHESERRALQAMRLVVVTSQRTGRALADFDVASDRIAVVEPGVDQPRHADERVCDPDAPVRMLCVATVTARKGHELLVDALTDLTEMDWTLTCVGSVERSPATVRALKMRIEASGLEDRVTLMGELDEAALQRQFRAADLFVLATHYEGYGMVVAQALAHGLPIISTRTGAIEELVRPEAGVLVEPGDWTALRDALSRVLADADLRRQLAAGARAAGAKLSSWSAASERMSEILASVAGALR